MARATRAPDRPATRTDPGTEAWGLMMDLLHANRPRFLAVLNELEISPPQSFALRLLGQETPTPMSEVAKGCGCDSSNMTGIVDRLEARGLVERQPVPGDRRVKGLVLTADGARLAAEIEQRLSWPPEALLHLPAADRRALRDILRRATGTRP